MSDTGVHAVCPGDDILAFQEGSLFAACHYIGTDTGVHAVCPGDDILALQEGSLFAACHYIGTDTGVHAVCPGDDILVQWRLQRKVEQARSESAVWSRCHLGRRDGGVAVDRTGWRGGGVAVDHVGRRDGGVAVDHTDMGVAVGSRDGGVAVDHTDMGVAVDHTDMGVAVGRRDGGVAHHTVNICPVSRIPCCFGRCCRVAEDNGMLGHSSCPLCQHQVKGQGHGSCQHQVKGQDREVQTSPDLVAREQEVSREDGQGRRGSVSSGNWSQGQPGGGCGQPGIGYGQSGSGCGLSGNRCWSKSGAQYSQCSRSEDSFSVELESTAETREQVSKAPPIDHENTPLHGGLALRDLTVSSADELTLTFNTDLGTERCNLGMGRSNTGLERSGMGMQSRTEMERSRMGMEAGDDGSGDTGVEQCMDNSPHSGEASTSTPTKGLSLITGRNIPLYWGGACIGVVLVLGWCLYWGGACIGVVLVLGWCLYWGGACIGVVLVLGWCLYWGGACIGVVLVLGWCLYWGGACIGVVLIQTCSGMDE